jgi:putative methionine-R-sulfoxide reductase with GAF domain
LPADRGDSSSPDVSAALEAALRYPVQDKATSLAELAKRDLDATLQLLAERAQYITGATGAAIALRVNGELICRATAGSCAPDLGAHLQVNSGLTGESVRTKQILRCDNAEEDPRVNRESCRILGIASVVVVPLIRNEEVFGVFELLSGEPSAFRERDIVALQRLAEMVQTALDHADAALRAQRGDISANPFAGAIDAAVGFAPGDTVPQDQPLISAEMDSGFAASPMADAGVSATVPPASASEAELHRGVAKCERCGFPVSDGRALCLDCENARETTPDPSDPGSASFLSQYGTEPTGRSWLRSHIYLIGIGVMAVLTAAMLLLRR